MGQITIENIAGHPGIHETVAQWLSQPAETRHYPLTIAKPRR